MKRLWQIKVEMGKKKKSSIKQNFCEIDSNTLILLEDILNAVS